MSFLFFYNQRTDQVTVAHHPYNLSYAGGRDQEDNGSKPAEGK
jgi:hypothetical protein